MPTPVSAGFQFGDTLLKFIDKLFGNYEKRVLRGLVGTGDGLSAHVAEFLKKYKEGDRTFDPKLIKHLKHYRRKWDADRKKLK